jgi:hypothetical protein
VWPGSAAAVAAENRRALHVLGFIIQHKPFLSLSLRPVSIILVARSKVGRSGVVVVVVGFTNRTKSYTHT